MDLPVTTFTQNSANFRGYVIVKSGISFSINNSNNFLFGFSFGKDKSKNKIVNRSVNELKERFFIHYMFKNKSIKAFRLLGSPESILINNNVDVCKYANGSSCHINNVNALEHAVMEMLERHFLSKIWYFNNRIILVHSYKIQSLYFKSYMLSGYNIPFTLTTLYDKRHGIWLCGSALKNSYKISLEHSKNEAMMLYEGIATNLHCYRSEYDNRKTLLRLDNVKGRTAVLQKEYLTQLIYNKKCNYEKDKIYSLKEIIENSEVNGDIYFINYNIPHHCVMQVFSKELYNIKQIRKNNNNFIPPDPFY